MSAQLLKLSNSATGTALDALAALLNNGYLRLYSGTRPADADTALSGNTLLAELRFSATAFPASSGGVATANAITSDASADATGTATFYRALKSDGTTVVADGGVSSGRTAVSVTAATNANPAALTSTAHGLSTGDRVTLAGATGSWAPVNGTWTVTVTGANTFTIPVDSTGFGALAGTVTFRADDLDMNSVAISSGAQVSVTSYTLTLPKG
jgi:hypothetical protein